jgi:hypothetical protein
LLDPEGSRAFYIDLVGRTFPFDQLDTVTVAVEAQAMGGVEIIESTWASSIEFTGTPIFYHKQAESVVF